MGKSNTKKYCHKQDRNGGNQNLANFHDRNALRFFWLGNPCLGWVCRCSLNWPCAWFGHSIFLLWNMPLWFYQFIYCQDCEDNHRHSQSVKDPSIDEFEIGVGWQLLLDRVVKCIHHQVWSESYHDCGFKMYIIDEKSNLGRQDEAHWWYENGYPEWKCQPFKVNSQTYHVWVSLNPDLSNNESIQGFIQC